MDAEQFREWKRCHEAANEYQQQEPRNRSTLQRFAGLEAHLALLASMDNPPSRDNLEFHVLWAEAQIAYARYYGLDIPGLTHPEE